MMALEWYWRAMLWAIVLATPMNACALLWRRRSRNCYWCKYERDCRANGQRLRIPPEHHTCWRCVK